MTPAAVVFLVLLGALAIFQIALACGAPWGRFAWGGQHEGVLPRRYRIASALSLLVYAVIALIALDRDGAIDVVPDAVSTVGMWVVFGYLVLGVLMNAISRSRHERYTATPVAIVLAVMAFFIAWGGPAVGESRPGFPDWVSPQEQEEMYMTVAGQPVAWIDGDRLTLVTFGSSSCPEDITGIEVPDAATVVVTLRSPGGACTDDLSPRTHEVVLPRAVTERPATVLVNPGSDWRREAVVE